MGRSALPGTEAAFNLEVIVTASSDPVSPATITVVPAGGTMVHPVLEEWRLRYALKRMVLQYLSVQMF